MASLAPHLRIKSCVRLSSLPKHSLRVCNSKKQIITQTTQTKQIFQRTAPILSYLKAPSFCNQRFYCSNSVHNTKNDFGDDTNKSIICNETTIKLLQPQLLPRTHNCGEITSDMVGKEVKIAGWVSSQRYLGKLVFILLRDMHSSIQLKYEPPANVEEDDISKALRDLTIESIIAVRGVVAKRPPEMINEKLKSGDLEVVVSQYELLNPSALPPFDLRADKLANEELRLKYRFLDLRRPALQRNILLRSRVAQITRNYFWDNGFTEVETPTLFKATPECGAKEFLVPTRDRGKFYALPQSPQQYKQITMASGIDKYFQLARCYRDEGIHPDRQPEFTQVDLEISFARPNDIYKTIEGLLKAIWKKELGVDIPTPFRHMQFEEAMSKYGIDKPDTRYALHIKDITSTLQQSNTSVKLFKESIQQGHRIKCINFKSLAANITNEEVTTLVNEAKKAGAKDLLVIKLVDGEWKNPIAKHLSEQEKSQLAKELDAQNGDLLCMSIGEHYPACSILGKVRIAGATMMKNKSLLSIPSDQYNFMWVVDFPLFSWEDNQMVSTHNPFTSPHPDDAQLLLSDDTQELLKIRALHYDCVLNGVEIGGGSIRIHNADLQTLVFKKLNINPQLFNHLLEALRYGCPPHGGLALGYDRLISIMCGAKSLREVIAFPKSTNGNELMTGSPAYVSSKDLQELGLQVLPQPKGENT